MQRRDLERFRKFGEELDADSGLVFFSESLFEELGESALETAGALGQGEEALVEIGVGGAQAGEEEMADAVARNRQVAIGRVLDRPDCESFEIALDLDAAHGEERAEERAEPLSDAAEAFERGAAQELEEHGLDLVVTVVRGEDECRAELDAQALERGVAQPPRGGFGALVALLLARQVQVLDNEQQLEPSRQRAGTLGARKRLGIAAMVDVDEMERRATIAGGRGRWSERSERRRQRR